MKYIVGDIHGEISKLKILIRLICSQDRLPEFIFIGDYIDKGENAKATLDFLDLIRKQFPCVFLLGNHEYYWKNAKDHKDYLLKYGGKNTIHSFGYKTIEETQSCLMDRYQDLFNLLIDFYIIDSYFITHSGIDPQLYFIENFNEIPTVSYLFNRYSFIQQECFFQKKYQIIFGHTAFFEPYTDSYKIGIDTAACYLPHQPLSAFCIEKKEFFNSHGKQYLLGSLPKNSCANIVRNKPYQFYD
jgi:serine/threonine protein phosphatase 1